MTPKRATSEGERSTIKVVIPPPPAPRCTWEQAEPYFNTLTDEQWSFIESYVYRLVPIIDRTLSDINHKSYIDIIQGKIDRDYIVSEHGGGVYNLKINDRTTLNKPLMNLKIEIPVTEAQPKLDIRELDLNENKNKRYIDKLIQEGKLTPDLKVAGNTPQSQMTSSGGNQTVPEAMYKMMSDMMQMFAKMSDQQQRQILDKISTRDEIGGTVGTILVEQMKQQNPNAMLSTVVDILGKQKNTAGEFTPIFTVMTTMMSQMSAMQSENTKMIVEVMKSSMENSKKNNSGDDEESGGTGLIGKVKEIIELASMIKGGRAAEKTTLEVVGDIVGILVPCPLHDSILP